MGHYDSCYEADNKINVEKQKEKAKKRHEKIRKELINLINELNDDERELLISIVKHIKSVQGLVDIMKTFSK